MLTLMRRRTKLLLLAVIVIALAGIALRQSQPRYKGRTLGYWVERVSYMNNGGLYDDQAVAAVRALRSIPEMLQDMDYDGTARRNRREAILRKLPHPLPGLLVHWAWADYRQSLEGAAVTILLKPDIDPAVVIPGLEQLVRSTNAVISYRATYVLLSKGSNGLAAFFNAVRDPGQGDPLRLLSYIGQIHGDRMWAAATPELIHLSQGEDLDIAQAARRTLEKMRAEHQRELERILAGLTNPEPTLRLSAVSYVPEPYGAELSIRAALSNALHDPDPDVREAAARTLTNLTPQVSTNFPPD